MKTKRARPQVTSNPGTMVFHDRAALATLRQFPDRRNGITAALETLTGVDWLLEFPDDSDRRLFGPELPSDTWHPVVLEPVQIEIANTDPEGFIGILCALLQGWWPSEAEHAAIRSAHEILQAETGKGWTHNHVQGPERGVVFSAPGDDGRVLFLSQIQIQDVLSGYYPLVNLVKEKLAGEHPAVFDNGLFPPAEPEPAEPPVAPSWEQPLAAGLEAAAAKRAETAHRLETDELRKQLDIAKADTLFTKDEGEHLTRNPGARMERNGLLLTAVNENGRTQTEQILSDHLTETMTPKGLVVDDENGLLNWEGENFVKQTLLQEYQMAARQVHEEQSASILRYEEEIARLKTAYADLLQQREVIDPIAENTYERDRAEAVELVEAILAGAGFELLRDGTDRSGAMWQQKLDIRPGVQVFLTVPEGVLAAGPANVYAYVKANVGVAQ